MKNTRPNIAILISGSGSNLQSFINQCQNKTLNANIALVISNRPNAYGLQRAQQANIPTAVVDHTRYEDREKFDHALAEELAKFQLDAVVLAGFMRILTPDFVAQFKGALFNIHPSLLPKYPGLHTHRRALEAGDSYAGTTVHFVTEELDGGPCIIRAQVPIHSNDTEQTLAKRVQQQEHIIYPLAIQWYLEQRLLLKNNAAYFDEKALPTTGLLYEST